MATLILYTELWFKNSTLSSLILSIAGFQVSLGSNNSLEPFQAHFASYHDVDVSSCILLSSWHSCLPKIQDIYSWL